MISKSVKLTAFYKELDNSNSKEYFDMSRDKFYHNIDSLYYMIECYNDWNTDVSAMCLKTHLEEYKEIALKENEYIQFPDTEYFIHGLGLPMYPYFLESTDRYSFFIAKHSIKGTPQIWVQLRSQYLWLYGTHQCVENSINEIENLLDRYDIKIKEIKENRIDFAYHTNYIQDPLNFFREDKLNSMQVSNFKRYSLEGRFVGEDDIERDYITMGRKKSNNLFFRVYNKTKEVIEMGYKQFFIELWHQNKMISNYDKYCIEKAFEKGNYDYLNIARLQFYLEHGTDNEIKNSINDYIEGYPERYNYEDIRKYADSFMPRVTIICNIEIETKRKFYSSLDKDCDALLKLKSECKEHSKKLFVKIDNIETFHNLLTENVIRFVDRKTATRKARCKTSSWWVRLQQCKVNHKYDQEQIEIIRQYQQNVDIEKLKQKTLRSISNLNLNIKAEDSLENDIRQDVADIMSLLTENEVQNLKIYKNKKFAQQSNRLVKTRLMDGQSDFAIINTATGELIS